MMKIKRPLLRRAQQNIVIFTTLIVLFLFFTIVNPNFIDRYNLLSMAQSFVPYAFLALGVTFVVATGGIDLSVGAVAIASALIAGRLYGLGMPLFFVVPIMIAIGALMGCLNGFLVAKLKVPAFIATLGTMMTIRGFSALLVKIPNVIFPSNTWFNRVFSNAGGFPIGIVWLVGFAALAVVIVYKTKIGRYILSIGSNEEATRLSGINVIKYKFIAYAICGTLAGVAGIFYSSSFATIVAASGDGMELEAIAGVYIGGTVAAGGSASVVGSLLGSYLLVVIRVGLNFLLPKLNIEFDSTYVTYVITGVIVVLSVVFDMLKKKKMDNGQRVDINKKKIIISSIISGSLVITMTIGTIFAVAFHNSKEKMIAVIAKGETHAFWKNVKAGATEVCQEAGYKLSFRGPEQESPKYLPDQRTLLQTAISNGADGICFSGIGEGFADLFQQAKQYNIPVVQFDSGIWPKDYEQIVNSAKNPVVSSVLNDNYGGGELAAEKLFDYVKDQIALAGSYTVGVIQHDQTVSAYERSGGFMDKFAALAEADSATKGKVNLELEVKPDVTNENYYNALATLKEEGAKAVFMTGEPVVTQIYDKIKSGLNQYNDIVFVGYDAGTRQIDWMKENNKPLLLGSIAQDSYKIGYQAVTQVIKAAQGKPVDTDITTPGIWWDVNNYEELKEQKIVYEG